LDHGHASEDLAGSEQLQDDVLARRRVPHDLHMARLDDVEPAGRVALHEDVLAGPMRLFDDETCQRLDLACGEPGEDRVSAKERRDVPRWHRRQDSTRRAGRRGVQSSIRPGDGVVGLGRRRTSAARAVKSSEHKAEAGMVAIIDETPDWWADLPNALADPY